MKKAITTLLYATLGALLALGFNAYFGKTPLKSSPHKPVTTPTIVQTNLGNALTAAAEYTDFTAAAEKTLNAVVHVKNTAVKTYRDPMAELFYGRGNGIKSFPQVGTGSGVIISEDGYIITNNHVIREATDIEITLNNSKVYKAVLVGADPTNDIALLKVETAGLPYITFGDSDHLKVGEWVLAVGNPYNLTSTVTAGIVSAKGRDLQGDRNINSFIQTDAAVNPGNSGGALVNTHGELVGINTAISSMTGSFVGYSFAVPSNIAKKVIEDIMEFGNVQTAILGLSGGELNASMAAELMLDIAEGFYISEVSEGSGAQKAGLVAKDVITGINGVEIATYADLTGFLRTKRAGDTVTVRYLRAGETRETFVVLTKKELSTLSVMGLSLKNLDKKALQRLALDNGVEITGISNRELRYYGVKKGYVIVAVNDQKIYSIEQLQTLVSEDDRDGVLRIEMRNLDGELERYIFR
ncbi:MAG: trypsin-like peptidase domain-containing protein [Lutibacter sp.]|jgi:Do/DeqQ family serine protease|nr:trypsin-like peptidase domain-containing protein [Lutibacter sp.]